MWKTYNVSSSEVRYVGLSFSTLIKYYRWFANIYPEEVWQITLLAALEAEPFDTLRDAGNTIQRIIRRQVRAFGWRQDSVTRRWFHPESTLLDETVTSQTRSEYLWERGDRCGVGGCQRMGEYQDDFFVYLCTMHYGYVQNQRETNESDPYQGIEQLRRGRISHIKVQCATCECSLLRERKEVFRYSRFFCSRSCHSKAIQLNFHHVRGVKHGRSKLDEMQVREIRNMLALGKTLNAIARTYRVDHGTIRSIRDGRSWTHVAAA